VKLFHFFTDFIYAVKFTAAYDNVGSWY